MTRRRVGDDQYGRLGRRLDEVKRRVDEGTIDYGLTMIALTAIIEGRFNEGNRFPAFNPNAFIGEGWCICHDNEVLPEAWEPSTARIVSAFPKGEPPLINGCYINGHEWIKRLAGHNLLGARAFLYFWGHQKVIPDEWKKVIVNFDATTLLYRGGECSLSLFQRDGAWCWDCRSLIYDRGYGFSACSS